MKTAHLATMAVTFMALVGDAALLTDLVAQPSVTLFESDPLV